MSISAKVIDYPRNGCVEGHVTSFKIWEISENIPELEQDREIVAIED